MTAILISESQRLQRSSLLLTGIFAALAVAFLAMFPTMREEAEAVREAYPDYLIEMLGLEAIHLIEGFAAGYIYPFLWVLFGGMYFAYIGGGLVADDIRVRKMDLTLSNPVSRESVLAQKTAALWVPLISLNAGMLVAISGGAALIGESFELLPLVMVHLLGLPYLLVCAGIGLVLSVTVDRPSRAQVLGLGLVFMLWLVDSISVMEPDVEWVGSFTPSRYYDPAEILVREEYAFLDASILLGGFVVLFGVATFHFVRRDI